MDDYMQELLIGFNYKHLNGKQRNLAEPFLTLAHRIASNPEISEEVSRESITNLLVSRNLAINELNKMEPSCRVTFTYSNGQLEHVNIPYIPQVDEKITIKGKSFIVKTRETRLYTQMDGSIECNVIIRLY